MIGRTKRMNVAVTALFLVCGALVPSSARGAEVEPVNVLTVRGTESAYVDFSLVEAVSIAPAESTIDTSGTFGGFALYELPSLKLRGGRTMIPAFEETGHPFGPFTFVLPQELAPGSYRMYLFTDGATTIRIPLQGLRRPMRLRPKTTAPIQADVLDLAAYPLVPFGAGRVPVDVRGADWMYLTLLQTAPVHAGGRMSVCAVPRGGVDCVVAGESPEGTALYPGVGVDTYSLKFAAGSAPPGPKDLLFNADGAGVQESLLAFYVVIHLPPAVE